jgi:hypothetical protein
VTDYKKYALGQVENFLYDAMSAEASPQEIYDVIKGVVSDNYYTYKHQASQAYELLTLLNGKETLKLSLEEFAGPYHNSICDRDDTSQECQNSWNSFWEESNQYTEEEITEMCDAAELERDLNNAEEFLKEDKVNKWIIPVDDDYNITFPEDLIEQTGWKEGDTLQWIDQGDGSFKMIKKEN